MHRIHISVFCLLLLTGTALFSGTTSLPSVRVGQVTGDSSNAFSRNYPDALPSLLKNIARVTSLNLDTDPVYVRDFSDEQIYRCPFIYINSADRRQWTFTPSEQNVLKQYLERGGFLFIDAGIIASFLRSDPGRSQHHSYAEWEAAPDIRKAFKDIFPDRDFQPLKRTDPLYSAFFKGLPDTSLLPETVRKYTIEEKWPDGTYSATALRIGDRIAVLTTPIIAMGWGQNSLGQWRTNINFRILQGNEGLDQFLKSAASSGPRYEVTREDHGKDIIFCQNGGLPAWVQEPGNVWRVFRYFSSREISDFAHQFYTRLGTNILVYALTR